MMIEVVVVMEVGMEAPAAAGWSINNRGSLVLVLARWVHGLCRRETDKVLRVEHQRGVST